MRKHILTVLIIPLIAALIMQPTGASERRRGRTIVYVSTSDQRRSANAYAGYFAEQRQISDLAEGAMTSGIAGH